MLKFSSSSKSVISIESVWSLIFSSAISVVEDIWLESFSEKSAISVEGVFSLLFSSSNSIISTDVGGFSVIISSASSTISIWGKIFVSANSVISVGDSIRLLFSSSSSTISIVVGLWPEFSWANSAISTTGDVGNDEEEDDDEDDDEDGDIDKDGISLFRSLTSKVSVIFSVVSVVVVFETIWLLCNFSTLDSTTVVIVVVVDWSSWLVMSVNVILTRI